MAGLKLIPVVPALAPLLCEEKTPALAAGVRSMAEVSLWQRKKQDMRPDGADDWRFVASELGEVQWTKYGISGIAVFQLSRYVAAEKGAMTFAVAYA
ncbi:MAG: hypothetical protein ACLTSZ_05105 [Lachnospiraceae bacterium]